MCTAVNQNTGADDYTFNSVGPFVLDNGVVGTGGGAINLEVPSGDSGAFHLTGVTSVPVGTCGF